MTTRWDYRLELVSGPVDALERDMKQFGQEGWELVQIEDTSPRLAWFKRRVDDDAEVLRLHARLREKLAVAEDLDCVIVDIASELGCAVDNEHILEVITKLKEERDKYRAALERLGSTEAFVLSRMIDKERDAELIARLEYARSAVAIK